MTYDVSRYTDEMVIDMMKSCQREYNKRFHPPKTKYVRMSDLPSEVRQKIVVNNSTPVLETYHGVIPKQDYIKHLESELKQRTNSRDHYREENKELKEIRDRLSEENKKLKQELSVSTISYIVTELEKSKNEISDLKKQNLFLSNENTKNSTLKHRYSERFYNLRNEIRKLVNENQVFDDTID